MEAHHVLIPAGSDAIAVAELWWVFLSICTVVYALVVGALLVAIFRGRRQLQGIGDTARVDARSRVVVGAAVAGTTLVLGGLLFADLMFGKAVLGEREPAGEPVRIRVTAHQFWWELQYPAKVPSGELLTANELVVPVGVPLEIELLSRDVIHSFWLPALAGKKDLIPGVSNTLRFSVIRPGSYEGQCAEFCGYQHANMRLALTAVHPEEFIAWKAAQLAPANPPGTSAQSRGQRVFESSACGLCHAVRGTLASASAGPDLTHFGSRLRIASTPLPNTPEALSRWISDPQRIKPGTNMPASELSASDLGALVSYLESLK